MPADTLGRILLALEGFTGKCGIAGLFACLVMPVLIFIDVACRLAGTGVPGALEVQEVMLVLATFSLMAWLQAREQHLSIDFVYNHFHGGVKAWADVFSPAVISCVMVVLMVQSCKTMLDNVGTLSQELYIPLEYYYFIPVAGFALCVLVMAVQLLRKIVIAIGEGHPLSVLVALGMAGFLAWVPFWYRESDVEISMLALGGIVFLLLFFFLFVKIPICWAMSSIGTMASIAIFRSVDAALNMVGSTPFTATASFNLVALPLFVLMGCMILHSGISFDMFNSANKWLGHMPGGMGMAGVAGCTGFAAVCGDSMSTAVTMGSVSLPEMQRLKYDPALATGALAAGGTLGILIPPSTGFIIYGIVTEVSIGRLFMAGVMPGLMLALLFMGYIYYVAVRYPERAPRGEKYTLGEKVRSSVGLLPIIGLFVLVLGSIVMGICSPTEGGAVGVVGAFAYALARRRVTVENMHSSFKETAILTSRIMSIMVGVGILGFFFAQSRLPLQLAQFIQALDCNRYLIFALIIAVYVGLGCMMNVIPMLMLTLPSIFPTVTALGFDPVWFGVVSVMVMEMGQITPPVGVVVFALSGVAKGIPMETIFKGITPFVLMIILGVILVTFFPAIATWLPYTLMGPEVM